MLEKISGPCRVLLLGFGREFKVRLQRGESRTQDRVKIFTLGEALLPGKRAGSHCAKKPHGKQSGGTTTLSLETANSLERENVHSSVFVSTTGVSRLIEATWSLATGGEAAQELVTKAASSL